MRVLVTGDAGHIGGYVREELLGVGHEVVGTDLVDPEDPRLVRHHTGDLRDRDLVRAALEGVEAVVHLGAVPHPNVPDGGDLYAANCLTAHRVLDESGRAGIRRVVAASSLSVLGLAWAPTPQSPCYVPVDEAHPLLMQDPYALSKAALEEIARATHRRYGTDVVCMRFPFVGAGERLRRQLASVAADSGYRTGELWGWLDTRDAAEAVRLGLEREVRGCHVVNVAAGDTSSPEPTAALLARHHAEVPVRGPLLGHDGLFDTRAATALLGFVPRRRWRAGASDAAPGEAS